MRRISTVALCCGLVLFAASAGRASRAAEPPSTAATMSATCSSSVGPGIPPPPVPADKTGTPGFHALWYGQSGYMSLCPGDTSTAVVAMYNSGSRGWAQSRMGEVAFLGTWNPTPGQDQPSILGGDGTNGSPATGWPRYNRVAVQPADYVGPNQIAWFQFTVKAPPTPGTYKLYIRPLIEGAQWMEDYGIYWQVTVLGAGVGVKTNSSFNPTTSAADGVSGSTLTVTIQDANGNTATSDNTTQITVTRSSGANVCTLPGIGGQATRVAQAGAVSFFVSSTTTPGSCQWDATTSPAMTGSSATLTTH
jgi:hypothetical protein